MRLIPLLLLLAVFSIAVTGCNNSSNIDTTDYVYVPEIIPFPDDLKEQISINNIVFFDESVYFVTGYNRIISMNINGTNLVELSYYPDSNAFIASLITDSSGNLWVTESKFAGQNMSDTVFLRKLDSTGAQLSAIDISGNVAGVGMYGMRFNVDNEENIYLGVEEKIIVLDNTGRLLFSLDVRDFWISQIIRMPDGDVAYFDGRGTIRKINIEEHGWGDTISLPYGASRAFAGNSEFRVLFISGMTLYGIDTETNEIVQVLDYIDSDLIFEILLNTELLADGRVLSVTLTPREMLAPPEIELIIMSKVPSSERQERTQLTLAGINIDRHIMSAVVQFNRTSNTHRIQITDYSVYNTGADDNAGLTRLSTEIIAGGIPDIFALSGLPFQQYAARGLFTDLGILLDNDPEINREDFIGSVLRAAETDGALYQIFPSFVIYSIIGNPEIIGGDTGWTVEEFNAVLDANPEADIPMGDGMSKIRFLHFAFSYNIEQFIDWNLGEAYFDRGDFARLLELADTFPMEAEQDVFSGPGAGAEEIAAGRQIMAWRQLSDFGVYRLNRTLYGSKIVFKGFPGENRASGIFDADSNIAISSRSENQQAAWEFVRLLLSEDFGRVNIHGSFPLNKKVFEERLADAMIADGREISLYGGTSVSIDEISAEEALQILAFIDSISSVLERDEMIWNIVSENASDFFNGRSNAQEAARIIQSRISILLSEQR